MLPQVHEEKERIAQERLRREQEVSKLPYDLRKPHKRIVTQQGHVILQNGILYEYGSGKVIGPVANNVTLSPGVKMVAKTGATFPDTPLGRLRMEQYIERHGLAEAAKPADQGKLNLKESSMEERHEAAKENKHNKKR